MNPVNAVVFLSGWALPNARVFLADGWHPFYLAFFFLMALSTPVAERLVRRHLQRAFPAFTATARGQRGLDLLQSLGYMHVVGMVMVGMFWQNDRATHQTTFSWLFGTFVVHYSLKFTLAALAGLGWELPRWIKQTFRRKAAPPAPPSPTEKHPAAAAGAPSQPTAERPPDPGRRDFLAKLAAGAALVPPAFFLQGISSGKYNFQVLERELFFPRLPLALDGLRILQLSDFHLGSFGSVDQVARGIRLATAQQFDLAVFTGDYVNNTSTEMAPWLELLSEVKAPLGVFAVRGNHDYGDYATWYDENAKQRDLTNLLNNITGLGHRLLENENVVLSHKGGRLQLAGTGFYRGSNLPPGELQYCDLPAATAGLDAQHFTLLLTHNPKHWDDEVRQHPHPTDLTLAGHTHGMQLGIHTPEFQFSPVQLFFRRWADHYREGPHQLYVNRGFGYTVFPGRVGIWPEITLLTLRRGRAS